MRDTDAVLLDDGDIFIIKMHAMRRQCAVVEKTCGSDVCKGTLAVLLEAFLHLPFRFRHVDVDFRSKRLCSLCDLVQIIGRARIERVRPEHHGDAPIGFLMPIFEELYIFCKLFVCVGHHTDQTARKNGAKP